MLAVSPVTNRALRDRLHAGLWFDGFRALGPAVFARPNWPLPWAGDRAREHATAAHGTCLRGWITESPAPLAQLYDLDGLDKQARTLARRIVQATARTGGADKAFAARIRFGGEAVQFLAHDPRLPPEILGTRTGIAELIECYAQFEKEMKKRSAGFVDSIVGRKGER